MLLMTTCRCRNLPSRGTRSAGILQQYVRPGRQRLAYGRVAAIDGLRRLFDFANLRARVRQTGRTLEGGFTMDDGPRSRPVIPEKLVDNLAPQIPGRRLHVQHRRRSGAGGGGFDSSIIRGMAALKGEMERAKAKYPQLKVMFHIAHSIYTTNQPERFADSKLIGKDGKQVVWSSEWNCMKVTTAKRGSMKAIAGTLLPPLENSYGKR